MRHAGKLPLCVLLGTIVILVSGCLVVRPHRHRGPHHIPPGHVRRAVHVHGHGCGHVWRDGRWVSVKIGVGF